ncbi:MAG: Sulfotransferase [Pedosphaera sp.]|nr:Sulfotransferase [Pedosphaera sp.]
MRPNVHPPVATMKLRPLLSKGALARMFEDAKEASRRQDYQKTIQILEGGSRRDPANTKVLLDLGLVNGMCYNYSAAESWFERAIRVSARRTETLIISGQHCQHFGQHEMAKSYFQRASEQRDAPAEVLVNLAELYERQHQLKTAAELIERAVQLNPACELALLARARMNRQVGQLEAAETLLRSILTKPNGDVWLRAQTWYELGAVLDRQSRYNEAMTVFLEAKALLRPNAGAATAALQEMQFRVKELERTVSEKVLQRWFQAGKELQPPRPLALLCGHPRSGTTLLEQVLDSHPGIISAEETPVLQEEAYMRFHNSLVADASMVSVLESTPISRLKELRENYFRFTESFMGKAINGRLLIDKNPSLTILIPFIIRLFPEIKFMVALRDPRDVCLSCFMQPLPVNPISSAYLTLEETVKDYAVTMNSWRAMAPRMQNQNIEVRYEDMVDVLEPVARRVLGFLGMPWDPDVMKFNEHARTKTVRSPTYADVTKPIYKGAVGRWRNYQKYLERHMDKLTPFIDAYGSC